MSLNPTSLVPLASAASPHRSREDGNPERNRNQNRTRKNPTMTRSTHPITRLSSALTLLLICCSSLLQVPAQAQTRPFDDGNSSLAVEGLILTRYALGVTGAPQLASTGINAVDAPAVEATISCPSCGLNITGNSAMTVADATIISR